MTEDTRKISSYTEQMISLRDIIAPMAEGFGFANARNLVIQSRVMVEGKLRSQYTQISPTPIIERVSPSLAAAFNSDLQIKIDDLRVFGISRTYPREKVVGTGNSYFVDAELVLGEIRGGFECELVSVEELPLSWNLILRRKPDERRGI